jgi:hypothetical protein
LPLIIPANTLSAAGYDVANSCRFDSTTAQYLDRTIESPTLGTKFTFSCWVKKDLNGDYHHILTSTANPGNFDIIRFDSSDNLQVIFQGGGDTITTNRKFRDNSAWYNIVVAVDTTQGVAANRVKIYINGTQETSFSTATYPDQDLIVNYQVSGKTLRIGANTWNVSAGNEMLGGYLAEVFFIDGVAHAASDFGEFNSDSPTIWQPKDCSGDFTYGTNGFFLDFADSGDLGDDESGNTNDFSETGLAATDQATDTPTNNFATMNSIANFRSGVTFAEGNTSVAMTTSKGGSTSTIGFGTGKWYAEMKIPTQPDSERFHFGILPFEIQAADDPIATSNQGIMLSGYSANLLGDNGSGSTEINTFYGNATGRFSGFTGILGIAIDSTSGTKTIAFSKDGAWITGSNATDTDFSNALEVDISTAFARHDTWHIGCGSGNGSGTTGIYNMNFGNPSFSISSSNADADGYGNFEYAVPSGYYALCTKNLGAYGG